MRLQKTLVELYRSRGNWLTSQATATYFVIFCGYQHIKVYHVIWCSNQWPSFIRFCMVTLYFCGLWPVHKSALWWWGEGYGYREGCKLIFYNFYSQNLYVALLRYNTCFMEIIIYIANCLISLKSWLAIFCLPLSLAFVFESGCSDLNICFKQNSETILGRSFHFPCPAFLWTLFIFLLYPVVRLSFFSFEFLKDISL